MSRVSATRSLVQVPARGRRRATRRQSDSGRGRAILGLGMVAFLALGFGTQGTFAFWMDEATITSGAFTSGTLDIKLNNELAGPGGATGFPVLALTNMVPGESVSASFPVANNGTVPLTFTVNGQATGGLASGMRFSLFSGTAGSQTGDSTTANRAGTCEGSPIPNAQGLTLTATSTTIVPVARPLAASGAAATESFCVLAKLDQNVDSSLQGQSMTASLKFNATQVLTP